MKTASSATNFTTRILVQACRTLTRNCNTDDDRCYPIPRGSGCTPQTSLEPVERFDVDIVNFPCALTSEATHKIESTRAKGERIHLNAHRHILVSVEASDISVGRGNAFASLCLRRGPAMHASFAGRLVVGGRRDQSGGNVNNTGGALLVVLARNGHAVDDKAMLFDPVDQDVSAPRIVV